MPDETQSVARKDDAPVPGLNETPAGSRIRISFFGLRNAGKSTLINALTGQEIAIVSDVPGTTTDPVSKAMEILPLGPCLLTDTAGLDDVGALGGERVRRTLDVLARTDIAVWVRAEPPGTAADDRETEFRATCRQLHIPILEYRRGDSVAAFKAALAVVRAVDAPPPLLAGLVKPGDAVVCVCPIDSAAPKGRLILPQQQVIRELLDGGCTAIVCTPAQLTAALTRPVALVVTDAQAFAAVAAVVPPDVPLTAFSILFARQKGDLAAYCAGLDAIARLRDGDRILVAEGCTHHRQCEDIGTVKIPKALAKLSGGKRLEFVFSSGGSFPIGTSPAEDRPPFALTVHCGGCMLTRRVVQSRIAACRAAGVPIVNYGLVLALANDIHADPQTALAVRGRDGFQSSS